MQVVLGETLLTAVVFLLSSILNFFKRTAAIFFSLLGVPSHETWYCSDPDRDERTSLRPDPDPFFVTALPCIPPSAFGPVGLFCASERKPSPESSLQSERPYCFPPLFLRMRLPPSCGATALQYFL